MLAISPNPGFPLLLAGLAMLFLPRPVRAPVLALAALAGVALLFTPDFGAYHPIEQLGLVLVGLRIDALSQVMGLGLLIISLAAIGASLAPRPAHAHAALGMTLGASVSALFVGDLVSFVAASELCVLCASWLLMAGGGQAAKRAGLRFLLWQAPASIALLAGVALEVAASGASSFGVIASGSVGAWLVIVSLLVRAGGAFTHPWLKDALAAATPATGLALAFAAPMLALYGLARAFPGEPALGVAGAAMVAVGGIFALIEADVRRALAAAIVAHFGLVLICLGAPGAVGVDAAAALAFTGGLGFALMLIGIGVATTQTGAYRAEALGGLAGAFPLSAAATVLGALTIVGAPLLAGHVGWGLAAEVAAAFSSALPGVGPWAYWAVLGVAMAHTAVRTPALVFLGRMKSAPLERTGAPGFGLLACLLLLMFLCAAIGVAPGWLQALLPDGGGALVLPWAGAAAWLQGFAAAGFCLALGQWTGFAPLQGARRTLDADDLLAGPVMAMLRWLGAWAQRLMQLAGLAGRFSAAALGAAARAIAARADQPFADGFFKPWLAPAAIAASIVLLNLWSFFSPD